MKGNEISLTFIELRMICLVLRHYPDILPKDVLVEQDTHIFNLNVKLKDWEYEIHSIKSKGIQLVKRT